MLKGLVTVVVRDAETLEEINRYEQSNIVTNEMYRMLSTNDILPSVIVISSHRLSPSVYNIAIPISNNTTVTGGPIPGKGNPDFFPATADNDMYAQWSTRVPAPVTDMTINTIALCQIAPSNTWWDINAQRTLAYMKLSTPCTQTSSQILDVYYRVYFPAASQGNRSLSTYTELARRMVGDVSLSNRGGGTIYRWLAYNESPLPQDPPSYTGRLHQGLWISSYVGNPAQFSAGKLYKVKYSQSFDINTLNGTMMQGMLTISSDFSATTGVVSSMTPITGISSIQNTIGHSIAATGPLMDVDALPSSSGTITPGGTWSPKVAGGLANGYSDGSFSSIRMINILTSGAVGTSTYNVSDVISFGTSHVACTIPGNNWAGRITDIPFFCGLEGTPDTSRFKFANVSARQLSTWMPYKNVGVLCPQANLLTIYNAATGEYWNYPATYTNIHQLAVAGDDIYIACRDTGLWRINPNTESAPSQVAAGSGMDLSHCYGVAVGYNNSVFCIGANGLFKLSGGNWTMYNETTSPQLLWAGITNNNWGNVEYIKVDSSATDNKMMIVKTYIDADSPQSMGCWWSETTAAVLAPNDHLDYIGWMGRPRTNRSQLAVCPDGSMWAAVIRGYHQILTFGSTTLTPCANYPSDIWCASTNFIQDNTGNWKLMVMIRGSNGYFNGLTPTTISPRLYNADGSVSYIGPTDGSCHATWLDPMSMQRCNITMTYTTGPYYGADGVVAFMMPGGVLFAAHSQYATNNVNTNLFLNACMGQVCLNSVSEGPLTNNAVITYGWDGSTWNRGSTTGKPTHTPSQQTIDGVTVSFQDGTAGTSFIATDYYTVGLCNGLFKDNATIASFEQSYYFKKAYSHVSELNMNAVPALTSGATGQMVLDLARSSSTDVSMDANGNFTFAEKNGGQQAIGNIPLIGNFTITWNISANTALNNTRFGIGWATSNQILAGWTINSNGNILSSFLTDITDITEQTRYESVNYFNPQTGWRTYGTTTTVQSLSISLNNGVLTFLVNGVVQPQNVQQPPPLSIPAGYTRFDAFGTPNPPLDVNYVNHNQIIPAPIVTINGADNAIKLGTALNGTGAYNPAFYGIDIDMTNAVTGTINGNLFSSVTYDGTPPLQGGVAISPATGTFTFNPADTQLPVTISCTYVTNE